MGELAMVVQKCWVIALFWMVFVWPMQALAHDETVSASRVEVGDHAIIWKVDVGIDGLRKAISLPEGDLDEAVLLERRDAIGGYLKGALAVTADARPLAAGIRRVDPIFEPSIVTGAPRGAPNLVEMIFATT